MAAAHDALVALHPEAAAPLDTALAAGLSALADGEAKTKGIEIGRRAAAAILAARAALRSAKVRAFSTSVLLLATLTCRAAGFHPWTAEEVQNLATVVISAERVLLFTAPTTLHLTQLREILRIIGSRRRSGTKLIADSSAPSKAGTKRWSRNTRPCTQIIVAQWGEQ